MADIRDITIEAGFDLIFYTQLNDEGYAVGGNGTVTAGDADGSPALRLDGAQTVDPSMPEPDVLTALGDDVPMLSESFEGADLPSGAIEVAVKDVQFEAYTTGGQVRTVAGLKVVQRGSSDQDKPQMAFIFQRRAKSWVRGFRGTRQRAGQIVLSCEVTPLGSAYEQRAFQGYRYGINMSKAGRLLWGETFSEANDSVHDSVISDITGDNAVHLHVFRGDNAQLTFNLEYTPLEPSTNTYVTINGAVQAYTTDYTISGKVLTMVAAPATNALVHVLYEFDRSEL